MDRDKEIELLLKKIKEMHDLDPAVALNASKELSEVLREKYYKREGEILKIKKDK